MKGRVEKSANGTYWWAKPPAMFGGGALGWDCFPSWGAAIRYALTGRML